MESIAQRETAQEVTSTRPLTNREMAGILFNIASVLREEGNTNRWRTEAYERGARALMAYPNEAFDVLANAETIPFRRRWHIGKKLQAKICEMARSGQLEQYRQLLTVQAPHRAELMNLPGVGPRTADRLQAFGIATQAEAVRAARDGRLRQVPGFGTKRTRAFASATGQEPNLFNLESDGYAHRQ